MVTQEIFKKTLEEIFDISRSLKLTGVVVKSGNLHRLVCGYPGSNHRMPICCDVMKHKMNDGDEVLAEPPSGHGATLEILYRL